MRLRQLGLCACDGQCPRGRRVSRARPEPAAMLNMKLKERLALALSAGAVLFTLMLVVDLQMDYGYTARRAPLHGRVRLGDDTDRGRGAYLEFRKRFLQKSSSGSGGNASREYEQSAADTSAGDTAPPAPPAPRATPTSTCSGCWRRRRGARGARGTTPSSCPRTATSTCCAPTTPPSGTWRTSSSGECVCVDVMRL
ncbi:unnamed protein product [Plutella xylostella]|uniref:(diamondback moth) hypothetical protein n=1 Tax=Plutella xylostella TaxID=51655 RepID=A0A8S4FZ83_PLUXY|nr:unnamed protein product [Plutella xylostella]